jgi:hypothetical protein
VVRLDAAAVLVRDWKTVRWDHDAALSRPQLEFYALCAARIVGADAAECELGIVTEEGAIGFERWALDWEDLARVAAEVIRAHTRALAARAARDEHERTHAAPWTPDVAEGAHCRYCPAALSSCPAKLAPVRAVAAGADPTENLTIADAFLRAKTLEAWAEKIRSTARLAVTERGELQTSTGEVIRFDSAGRLRASRLRTVA